MSRDQDHDRFVKLAFCRADLLLELGSSQEVVFAAGATEVVFGRTPDQMMGAEFLSLVADSDRTMARQILVAAGEQGRIDDATLCLAGIKGRTPRAVIAGYRAADFDGHFFVAMKMDPRSHVLVAQVGDGATDEETALLEEGSFSRLAAERVGAFHASGGRAQITLMKVENLGELLRKLGASKKKELLATVGEILRDDALGGDAAARIDEESFSFVHPEDLAVEEINEKIEGIAEDADESGEITVKGYYETLDADGAGLSEEQVAKALIHTMHRFCDEGTTGRTNSLSQVVNTMMADTVKTVATIRDIAEQEDLDLVYMPICDMRLGKVHHFEALTRFRDERYSGSPFQLVALAEEVDIVHDLDLAICRKAVHGIKTFNDKAPLPPIAVNLSGKSLGNDAFVADLLDFLDTSGVPAGKLMFEITESARVDNLQQINVNIQRFRKQGYKFALDDFGAGSASFDYLNMLDADYVKFDGPVVRRACVTQRGGDLLGTMAKMCTNHNVQTIAEMIEDRQMANQIYYCGIDYGQGWHFGKPTKNPYEFSDKFVGQVIEADD